MSRTKKKRAFVHQYLPADPVISKQERLADGDSYESRKKRAQEKKKKHKSVYQKAQENEQAAQNSEPTQRGARGGRLADKIRKLNQQKDSSDSDA
ncbi:hypothetical protein [Neptunomonas marina]|uniref:Uncharacterized protein n=1 Tax=Neptunomonas marina TaxID=1815562 RepID=A0A437Q989_9GAMM|nr:hypothetical protein [Neptunomonas marina]RVU31036.1 hypothetical protein EOE65_08485 [Neptunomonas marina]